MNPLKAVLFFAIGVALGALLITVADRIYEGGWRGGPTLAWLSLPVTVVYFLLLLGATAWHPSLFTPWGFAAAGFLCGIFPFFFGFFPVYYLRFIFAVPVVMVQLALLAVTILICAKFAKV
jgi:hypothetical protein